MYVCIPLCVTSGRVQSVTQERTRMMSARIGRGRRSTAKLAVPFSIARGQENTGRRNIWITPLGICGPDLSNPHEQTPCNRREGCGYEPRTGKDDYRREEKENERE